MAESSYSDFGASYVARGFELAFQKGVRRYALIPLAINIVLFSIAIAAVFHYTTVWVADFMAWLPEWLHWLEFVLWPLIIIAVLLLFAMTLPALRILLPRHLIACLPKRLKRD